MRRIDLITTAGLLLLTMTFQMGCSVEKVSTDASSTVAVYAPERWLDFSMAAPDPVAVRPDGQRVVVEAGCETIVYDLAPLKRVHAWTERFSSVQYSRDGRFLLTVRGDEVAVWNAETFAEARRFTGQRPRWDEPNYRS